MVEGLDARSYSLSAYCCIPLQPSFDHDSQSKALSLDMFVITNIPVNTLAKRLEGEEALTGRNRCGGDGSMRLLSVASI
jgi:hypothetical protein